MKFPFFNLKEKIDQSEEEYNVFIAVYLAIKWFVTMYGIVFLIIAVFVVLFVLIPCWIHQH